MTHTLARLAIRVLFGPSVPPTSHNWSVWTLRGIGCTIYRVHCSKQWIICVCFGYSKHVNRCDLEMTLTLFSFTIDAYGLRQTWPHSAHLKTPYWRSCICRGASEAADRANRPWSQSTRVTHKYSSIFVGEPYRSQTLRPTNDLISPVVFLPKGNGFSNYFA